MIVTGGIRRDGFSVLVGDIAEEFIKRLYVDIAFVGADAASVEHGVFNSNFICIIQNTYDLCISEIWRIFFFSA